MIGLRSLGFKTPRCDERHGLNEGRLETDDTHYSVRCVLALKPCSERETRFYNCSETDDAATLYYRQIAITWGESLYVQLKPSSVSEIRIQGHRGSDGKLTSKGFSA